MFDDNLVRVIVADGVDYIAVVFYIGFDKRHNHLVLPARSLLILLYFFCSQLIK